MERSNVIDDRFAAGPITWGVCEVPGWGTMLPAERVLSEMASLGITATELGAPGFLPHRADDLNAVLETHGVRLVASFLPLVLHDRLRRDETLSRARATARLLAATGASVLVSAAIADDRWSQPDVVAPAQWDHLAGMLDALDELCADQGLVHALHPHVGTLVETRDDVRTVLEKSSVAWCLDTGHLLIGGYDPATFAADASGRVAHAHLKDVAPGLGEAVAGRRRSLIDAVRDGLFRPLGRDIAPVAATVEQLEHDGYQGWYVLEQDTDLGRHVPAPGEGPIADARLSVDYLREVLAGQPAG